MFVMALLRTRTHIYFIFKILIKGIICACCSIQFVKQERFEIYNVSGISLKKRYEKDLIHEYKPLLLFSLMP